MQQREKILLFGLIGALVVWAGIYVFREKLSGPVSERQAQITALGEQLQRREDEQLRVLAAARRLGRWKEQSLPPDPLEAQRLYQEWLTRLAHAAGITDAKVSPGRRLPRGKLYTAVQVSISGKASLERLARFLYWFERTDLLHRVGNLDVESSQNRGDPALTFTLTAEGLALKDAKPRQRLFPETALEASISTGATSMTVKDTAGFPKTAPFHVRLGGELVTVTEVSEKTWTVRARVDGDGQSDSARVGRHPAGEPVELAPLTPAASGRTLADYRQDLFAAGKSPFVLPEAARPPRTREDEARQTELVATILEGTTRTAWLYNQATRRETVLAEGDSFRVAEIEGTVSRVGDGFVLFRWDEGSWRLELGENLRSMQRTTATAEGPGVTASRNGAAR